MTSACTASPNFIDTDSTNSLPDPVKKTNSSRNRLNYTSHCPNESHTKKLSDTQEYDRPMVLKDRVSDCPSDCQFTSHSDETEEGSMSDSFDIVSDYHDFANEEGNNLMDRPGATSFNFVPVNDKEIRNNQSSTYDVCFTYKI